MKWFSANPILGAVLVATLSWADSSRGEITQEQWLADAEFAVEQIRSVHPDMADAVLSGRLKVALQDFERSPSASREDLQGKSEEGRKRQ